MLYDSKGGREGCFLISKGEGVLFYFEGREREGCFLISKGEGEVLFDFEGRGAF